MTIEPARPTDVELVNGLLADAELPLAGAAAAFGRGVVARDATGIVGAAALEAFGDAGLLRSLVVAPGRRGSGVGRDLVAHVERLARAGGISQIYLITETAAGYFPRLGYEPVPREVVPESIAGSIEFTTACSSSAVVMRRTLDPINRLDLRVT